MNKPVYQAPKIQLHIVQVEEAIAVGSVVVDAYTTDESVKIYDYEYESQDNEIFLNF